jgi:Tfp pilus assembly protein PilV
MSLRRRNSEAGASLVEVLVAMLVTVVGTLSVATLMAYGTSLQVTSRDTTTAAAVARQQMERLRMLPPMSPSRAIGGSLTANVNNYTAEVDTTHGRFRVRWQVTPGPAGTKQVEMIVLSVSSNLQLAQIGGSVWP